MMLTYWPTTRPAVHESGPVPLGVECAMPDDGWNPAACSREFYVDASIHRHAQPMLPGPAWPEPGTIVTDDEAEHLLESQGFADSLSGVLDERRAQVEPWARICAGGLLLSLLTAWWLL